MRAFEVRGESSVAFVTRVKAELATRGMDHVVQVDHRGDRIEVRLSYLGRSRVSFRLEEEAGRFAARPEAATISPLHLPFRQRVDAQLDALLGELGATLL
jgi:hypothetical protein